MSEISQGFGQALRESFERNRIMQLEIRVEALEATVNRLIKLNAAIVDQLPDNTREQFESECG